MNYSGLVSIVLKIETSEHTLLQNFIFLNKSHQLTNCQTNQANRSLRIEVSVLASWEHVQATVLEVFAVESLDSVSSLLAACIIDQCSHHHGSLAGLVGWNIWRKDKLDVSTDAGEVISDVALISGVRQIGNIDWPQFSQRKRRRAHFGFLSIF